MVSRETREEVTQSRGNKDFWTRMEKVFKVIQFPVPGRRGPRAWWSIQVKSDHRFLACRPEATCTCGVRCCYQARTCCPMCTEANAVTLAFDKRKGFIAVNRP